MSQRWNAETSLQYWISRNQNMPDTSSETNGSDTLYFYEENDTIPIEELEMIVVKAARLVRVLGMEYIDVFERAESELKLAIQRMGTMERINSFALSDKPSNTKRYLLKP